MEITKNDQPINEYSTQRHDPPCAYQKNYKTMKNACSQRDEPSQSIYHGSQSSRDKYYGNTQRLAETPNKDSGRSWSRNNIVLTMEYFEPMSSTTAPKRYPNQSDYSYAYYEPGAVMRHSNVPNTLPNKRLSAPATQSSPKSISSLLVNVKTMPNHRHTYTTRYGTQENIYEDVSSIKTLPDRISSSQTLNMKSSSKIEFQDILHNHYRVLEQLNLSVEEMLLSTTTKIKVPPKTLKRSTKSRTVAKNSDIIKSRNEFPCSLHELLVGEDSGFSGSNSSASNVGSLRNYKTTMTRCNCDSPEVDYLNGPERKHRHIPNESRTFSHKINSQFKGLKLPFWSKR
ncbi:hypothetical protein Bhyg_07373 [Pseudolycoriella hygida]|uniref:Uncharacterized protein n=1 Tax=Pseudolycoriella hygida TaxID=35572 RepID=A0A9Q0N2G8_9DIPT|nr:hypothetical protein Bhyg_07373 [Pseudolycoriella hygida]